MHSLAWKAGGGGLSHGFRKPEGGYPPDLEQASIAQFLPAPTPMKIMQSQNSTLYTGVMQVYFTESMEHDNKWTKMVLSYAVAQSIVVLIFLPMLSQGIHRQQTTSVSDRC